MSIKERIKDILVISSIICFAIVSYNAIMFLFIIEGNKLAKMFVVEGNILLLIVSIFITRREYKKYLNEI